MLKTPNKEQTISLFAYSLAKIETEDKTPYFYGSLLETMNEINRIYENRFLDIYSLLLKEYGEDLLDNIGYDILCERFIEGEFKKGFKDSQEFVDYMTEDIKELDMVSDALSSIKESNRNLGFEKEMLIDLFKNYVTENGAPLVGSGYFADSFIVEISNNYKNIEVAKMGLKLWDIIKDEINQDINQYNDFNNDFNLDMEFEDLILGFGVYEYIEMLFNEVFENMKEESYG